MPEHVSVSVSIRVESGYSVQAVSEVKRTLTDTGRITSEISAAVEDAHLELERAMAARARAEARAARDADTL